MGKSLSLSDPYDIPRHLTPPGMTYQWVSKKTFGEIDRQYQTMLDAGWQPVPYVRLLDFYRGRYRGDGDTVNIGGQVLMERALEQSKVARDKEMDKAVINANSGRDIGIDLVSRILMSAHDIKSAADAGMSSTQYAKKRIKDISDGRDFTYLSGWNGSLQFTTPPVYRKERYRWLRWLFNLISKEDVHDDRRT